MNDLTSRALELQHAAHELMYLGMDGEPVYSDTFCRLNKEVLVKSDSLFSAQSSDVEEEANLCLALLMGYNVLLSMMMEIKSRRSKQYWTGFIQFWNNFLPLCLKFIC